MRNRLAAVRLILALILASIPSPAQVLEPLGPPGGDVRSLVADPRDPHRLYLGTSDGHLFTSEDGGAHWNLLSRVGDRDDTVVMSLLVHARDSHILFAGTWTLNGIDGGVFRSNDSGRTWKPSGLAGQTVRMLAQSASNPEILAAATLDGVFRSRDMGHRWERISPAGHDDLRNFDSVAIDPADPDLIYAGTYHLAWKTTDGGVRWVPMHRGMIDDSDVMDIQIDRTNPQRIFATACSGMYRSENQGELWAKIQGIPATARRTHFIRQDPQRPQVFYAGTTAGLWKSTDGGVTWKRTTPADWSAIGLVIDPSRPDRLVLGLERRGMVVSDDGGTTFRASNDGFYHQQIVSFATHPENPARMLVVLTNSAVPVLATTDAGQTWAPLGPGLRVEQLRRVYGSPDGWRAALERGGLLRYDEKKGAWVRAGKVKMQIAAKPAPKAAAKSRRGKPTPTEQLRDMFEVVHDMAFAPGQWFIATPRGLLASRDHGATWSDFSAALSGPAAARSLLVSSDGTEFWTVSPHEFAHSADSGKTWDRHALPVEGSKDVRLHRPDATTFVISSNRGLFISNDGGQRWNQAGLSEVLIADFAAADGTFLASSQRGGLFASSDGGKRWTRVEGPGTQAQFPFLKEMRETGAIVAASATEGLSTFEVRPRAQVASRAGSTPRQTGRVQDQR